jgi:ribonuclease HII
VIKEIKTKEAEGMEEAEVETIETEAEEDNLCGIDEAGRGCLAGPLVVAGVVLKIPIDGLDDSKKLTPKKREKLFETIKENSHYKIIFTDNQTIDKIGLSKALHNSIKEIKEHFKDHNILMDGNTNFGVAGVEWMVKADAKVPAVSAASILAKVSRDRYMVKVSQEFPEYDFAKHKGYGTKEHINMIKRYGYCSLHRKSFYIKSLRQGTLF